MNKFKDIKKIIVEKPLKLDCGQTINNYPLAYETYGKLNSDRSNAIMIFHALTGDQFASGINPITKKMVGGIMLLDLEGQLILIDIL